MLPVLLAGDRRDDSEPDRGHNIFYGNIFYGLKDGIVTDMLAPFDSPALMQQINAILRVCSGRVDR